MLKKILTKTHLWMGLTSGGVVFILGITGCILAFVEELKPIIYHDRYFVESTVNPEHVPSIANLLKVAGQHWGTKKPVSALEIENDPQRSWHFRAYQEDENGGIWYWNEKKYYESLYLNPYTGSKIHCENSEYEFFRVILYLHYSLLLKSSIGQPIVGTATLIFVLLLLTGLYLWWPKNRKARRVRFWFRWKRDTSLKRRYYDLHNILGFYSLSVALLIGLTGMVWAFSWFNKSALWIFDKVIASPAQQKERLIYPARITANQDISMYDRILCEVRQDFPNAESYYFYFPAKQGGTLNVYIRFDKNISSIIRQYDPQDGSLLKAIDSSNRNSAQKMQALNYDIHLGSILGIAGKALVFLASLISASLPVTGFYIWYNRGRKRRKYCGGRRNILTSTYHNSKFNG